ncbi:MAG: helix-turn-helix domain-containing protein [Cyanobacteria bacterium P01_E01_bin.43]
MLRLNHRGWRTEQIADYLNCQVATVRKAIHRWQQDGLYGLWDSPRPGRPVTWSIADIEHLTEKIETSAETFNSRQLAQELEEARAVKLSRRHLRRVLKKKISVETDSAKPSKAARPRRAIAKTS